MIRRALICSLLAVSTLAQAASWRVPLAEAADALEQARAEAAGTRGRCRDAVLERFEVTLGRVEQLRANSNEGSFTDARQVVAAAVDRATAARCPPEVVNALLLARADVESARVARFGGVPAGNPPPPPPVATAPLIEIAPLRIGPGGRREGNPGLRVELQSVRVRGLNGHTFQIAFNVRHEQGGWGQWSPTRDVTVTTDDFTASNLHQALFGVRELFPNGPPPTDRFVAHVGIFENGREVSSRDETFQLPPGLFGPPPPGFVVGTLPVVRDCGTGDDPGCTMQRGGQFPMDKETFDGLVVSLKNTMSPFDRRDMLKDVLANTYLTTKQFAAILGLIQGNFRMEAAQVAVPRLVNPKAALGLSSQFSSPFDQRDYVKLVSQQP